MSYIIRVWSCCFCFWILILTTLNIVGFVQFNFKEKIHLVPISDYERMIVGSCFKTSYGSNIYPYKVVDLNSNGFYCVMINGWEKGVVYFSKKELKADEFKVISY